MKLPLLALALSMGALIGCGMTNSEIKEEIEFCHSHNLNAEPLRNLEGRIKGIQCAPK